MRICYETWRTLALVLLAALAGTGTLCRVVSALADDNDTGMQRLIEARYRAWMQWTQDHSELGYSSESNDWAFDNEPYRQLVALGPRAVPCLAAGLRGADPDAMCAVMEDITKVRFHFHNESLAPGRERWTVDEFPGVQWNRTPNDVELMQRWWNDERFHTPERFAKLYAERQALLQQGDAKGAQEKYERIQNLGIAVLPCLLDKIGQGATDLVPIMSALTNGAVKPDASPADCAKWWNAHKQEWTLPPTAADKAK
jgi:hypothetical protein